MTSPRSFSRTKHHNTNLILGVSFVLIVIVLFLTVGRGGPAFLRGPCNALTFTSGVSSLTNTSCDAAKQTKFGIDVDDFIDDAPNTLYYEVKKSGEPTYFIPYGDSAAYDLAASKAFASTSLPIKGALTNRFEVLSTGVVKVVIKYKKDRGTSYTIA